MTSFLLISSISLRLRVLRLLKESFVFPRAKEETRQLFDKTVSFGRVFTICGKNVRKPNKEVAQIILEIRYSNRPLLAQGMTSK
jgi:hypothetical protein